MPTAFNIIPDLRHSRVLDHTAVKIAVTARRLSTCDRRHYAEDAWTVGMDHTTIALDSKVDATSYARNGASPRAIPSIVVNDNPRPGTAASQTSSGRLRRPKSRKSDKQMPPPNLENPIAIEPFEGLLTSIPSGDFEDPFASSDLAFSKRGSVLWQGSKPSGLENRNGHTRGTGNSTSSMLKFNSSQLLEEPRVGQSRPKSAQDGRGFANGDIQKRPLSADDHRLSQRIRSWYDVQDKAFSSEVGQLDAIQDTNIPGSEEADQVPDLPGNLSPRLDSIDDRLRESRSTSALSSLGSAAGGIEDWTDLDSTDVDRYGFYSARALNSKRSSAIFASTPGSPETQKAILASQGLVVDGDSRRPQSQQTSRSALYAKVNRLSMSAGGRPLRTSPSLQTSRSKRSSMVLHPMSKSRRQLDEASNMLDPIILFGADEHRPQADFTTNFPYDRTLECKRALKWARMATPVTTQVSKKGGGTDFQFDTTSAKMISRTWKGIPDCWRGAAWYSFLATSAKRQSMKGNAQASDSQLETFFMECQSQDCDDDVQIDMDVPRTVGAHVVFRQRYMGGQRFLFRVLRALSLYFPQTGYVQGMASLVATLLNYYTEERAFVMAVRMWTLRGIGWLYREGFEGLTSALKELEKKWMNRSAVAKQLEQHGISIMGWGPKWYLTLFNYVLPFAAQLRVWDMFMLLGDSAASLSPSRGLSSPRTTGSSGLEDGQQANQPNLDVLHATSTAILFALHDTIVDADFENAMRVLTVPVPVGNADVLMSVAKREWNAQNGK